MVSAFANIIIRYLHLRILKINIGTITIVYTSPRSRYCDATPRPCRFCCQRIDAWCKLDKLRVHVHVWLSHTACSSYHNPRSPYKKLLMARDLILPVPSSLDFWVHVEIWYSFSLKLYMHIAHAEMLVTSEFYFALIMWRFVVIQLVKIMRH